MGSGRTEDGGRMTFRIIVPVDIDDSSAGGPDLVTNGGFDADTDWTKGTGWSIAAGVASADGTQVADTDLFQAITSATIGVDYEITYTLSNFSAGTVEVVAGTAVGTSRAANGTYTETLTLTGTKDLIVRGDASFIGDIDNISFKLPISNIAEDDEAEYDDATVYALGAIVMVTNFNEPNIHRIFQSTEAANQGNKPWLEDQSSATKKWAFVGSTNRWKMFRTEVGDTTTNPGSIVSVITPGVRVNSIALFQVEASTVQIIVTSVTGGGETFNKTVDTVSSQGINSWYTWLFNPIQRTNTLVIFDIPNFKDNVITIIITEATLAECGIFVVGNQQTLGLTQYGMSTGINDFSEKSTDAFGNITVDDKGFSDRLEALVELDTSDYDNVKKTLNSVRGIPIVWVGSELFEASIVYGFYLSFDPILESFGVSSVSLSVEGLIQQ